MKKQGKAYRVSKTLWAVNNRLQAASQGAIRDISAMYDLELCYDSGKLYACCWIDNDMYYAVEPGCLN